MSLKQATVIPYCAECRTHFGVHCRHHRAGKPPVAASVWEIDAIPGDELP